MKGIKLLPVLFILFFSSSLNAQIFINTGNPNIDKYKSENPNAVIWEKGKNVPIPPNTPEEKKEPKAEPVKKELGAKIKTVKQTVKKQEPVKAETPVIETTTAKQPEGDFPPNAVPGKCDARCLAANQYEIKEEQVIDKPASVKVTKIPAKYETIYDTVVVKAAIKKTMTTPAKYETVTEDKLVTPATQKWVKGQSDKNCLSQNPKDCEVWCLKEIPAVHEKVTRKVEKAAAITSEVEFPAVTKVLPRKKLIEPASESKTEIPATYKTVMKKTLVKKGGYQEWKEVMCEQKITTNKISDIQAALKREGYDPGPVDNQMGGKTKQALIKFQQDKGLPVGNMNVETMKALGIGE